MRTATAALAAALLFVVLTALTLPLSLGGAVLFVLSLIFLFGVEGRDVPWGVVCAVGAPTALVLSGALAVVYQAMAVAAARQRGPLRHRVAGMADALPHEVEETGSGSWWQVPSVLIARLAVPALWGFSRLVQRIAPAPASTGLVRAVRVLRGREDLAGVLALLEKQGNALRGTFARMSGLWREPAAVQARALSTAVADLVWSGLARVGRAEWTDGRWRHVAGLDVPAAVAEAVERYRVAELRDLLRREGVDLASWPSR